MKAKSILPVVTATLLFAGYQAQAAQGTARALMKVISAITVNNVSDLIFAEAAAGAAAETVAEVNSETPNNASFAVVGEPNRAVTVTLPADGTVKMITAGGGSVDNEIAVNQFTSNSITQIDPSGTSQLYVGATRETLSATQTAGDYEGTFTVDVIYQ